MIVRFRIIQLKNGKFILEDDRYNEYLHKKGPMFSISTSSIFDNNNKVGEFDTIEEAESRIKEIVDFEKGIEVKGLVAQYDSQGHKFEIKDFKVEMGPVIK